MQAQFIFIRTRMNMADRAFWRFERHLFGFLPNVHEMTFLMFKVTEHGYQQVHGPQKAKDLLRVFLVHLSATPDMIDAALWRAAQADMKLCRGIHVVTMSQLQLEVGFRGRLALSSIAELFASRVQQGAHPMRWHALPRQSPLALPARITPSP